MSLEQKQNTPENYDFIKDGLNGKEFKQIKSMELGKEGSLSDRMRSEISKPINSQAKYIESIITKRGGNLETHLKQSKADCAVFQLKCKLEGTYTGKIDGKYSSELLTSAKSIKTNQEVDIQTSQLSQSVQATNKPVDKSIEDPVEQTTGGVEDDILLDDSQELELTVSDGGLVSDKVELEGKDNDNSEIVDYELKYNVLPKLLDQFNDIGINEFANSVQRFLFINNFASFESKITFLKNINFNFDENLDVQISSLISIDGRKMPLEFSLSDVFNNNSGTEIDNIKSGLRPDLLKSFLDNLTLLENKSIKS